MYEKVNPSHPDKLADRIAGAIVDWCYSVESDPKVAVEVLLGHGRCWITGEASVAVPESVIVGIVDRIAGPMSVESFIAEQDGHLAGNQAEGFRCGDNGIFKGCPVTDEQRWLSDVARVLYETFMSDGKCMTSGGVTTICQSLASEDQIRSVLGDGSWIINPLGEWTGGPDVDSGATNRKLGSDMGDAVTGGGLHGKDLSKADVTVNICAHIAAQATGSPVEYSCSIGDEEVGGTPFSEMVETARAYVRSIGGFEALAEWGLI